MTNNQKTKQTKYEVARDKEGINWYPFTYLYQCIFKEGADWASAYERERAAKLVDALKQIKERRETLQTRVYMNIGDAQELASDALAAYESGE